MVSELVLASAIRTIEGAIEGFGCKVTQGQNFSRFKRICGMRTGRPISAQADELFFDLHQGNSFYLVIEKEGQAVATIAVLRDDLKGDNLANLWRKRAKRLQKGRLGKHHAPGMFDITGDVVYLGDLWIDDRVKRVGLAYLLPKLALLIAYMRYEFAYAYALVSPKFGRNGTLNLTGFRTSEPGALDWRIADPDFNEEFWLVYSAASQICHEIGLIYAQR